MAVGNISVDASGSLLELVALFGKEDPISLYKLNKSFSIDEIRRLLVVQAGCKKCWNAFPLESCVRWPDLDAVDGADHGAPPVPVAKVCEHKIFANHKWPTMAKKTCGGDLVKVVTRVNQEPRIQAQLPVVTYPLVEWFFRCTRVPGFNEMIEHPREQLKQWKLGDTLCEIWHGRVWQELRSVLDRKRTVALILFLDGIGAFKTRRYSLWAVLFAIANLWRHLRWRRKFVHLQQLLPGGTESADTNRLIAPLSKQLKALLDGVLFDGERWQFVLLQISGDASARAKAAAWQHLCGQSGCITCPVHFEPLPADVLTELLDEPLDAAPGDDVDAAPADGKDDGDTAERKESKDEKESGDEGNNSGHKQRSPPKRLNYFTDWDKDLGFRDSDQMRRDSEQYRQARTFGDRDEITQKTGTRDSCFMRDLPNLRLPLQIAVDGFHTMYPNTCGVSSVW